MRDLASSVLSLSWAAGNQLGSFLETAFQAGGELQSEMLDLAFGALAPGGAARSAARIATSTAETLRFAGPHADGAAARQELCNKLEVYRLVRNVDRILALPPPGEPFDLPVYVERAYRHDAHRAMWLVEGLGHAYAARRLAEAAPSGILTRAEVPEASRLMLHAGLGMALAEHRLAELTPRSPLPRARRLVDEFVALCHGNSRPGCEDAALESFGLMARCFYPDLVPILGRAIDAAGDETLRGYFWHGVGRGTYFVPVSFIPGYGSIWHAIEMSQRRAPHARAASNSLAGVAYAVVLVNLARPAVLESLLRHHGVKLRGSSFSAGLVSALLMRRNITPRDPGLERFLEHRPAPSEPRLAALWRELILRPWEEALDGRPSAAGEVYHSLVSPQRLGLAGAGRRGNRPGGAP